LINESATEGEYHRAIQNAKRILHIQELEDRFRKMGVNPSSALASPRKRLLFLLSGLIIGSLLTYFLFVFKPVPDQDDLTQKYDLLKWSFESSFVNPYIKLRELPADCDYPCYKYQGRWELKQEYKLPFLRERSGFHYVATNAVMYARCTPEQNSDGMKIKGYEYQKHEIWYDKRELPISSFIQENGLPREAYIELNFNRNKNFIKIATIHSFYENDFIVGTNVIERAGKDIGRDVEIIPLPSLREKLSDEVILQDLMQELNLITRDPLLDFSRPSSCEPAKVPRDNYNALAEGDEMVFECSMTTASFPVKYIKTYQLRDQYIKERCIPRTEDITTAQ
jgi:hypothetical protein